MALQYAALVDEVTRGVDPGSGYLGQPVTGTLEPTFSPDDTPRDEFRGQDTALGNASVVRRSAQWTHELETPWYPDCKATALLFKHLLGFGGTRSVLDTTAYKGIYYPMAAYSGGSLGYVVNSDEGGTTKKRYYGGALVKAVKITGTGTDDIKLVWTLQGAGGWIGAEGTAIALPTMPSASPYVASDMLCYIGSGISRTGTGPDYTAIEQGTAVAYVPDSVDITLTSGFDDKIVMDGVKGPSKTHRSGKFTGEITAPIDYDDPVSGFSSADQYKALFDGPATTGLLFLLDNKELAGAATENYTAALDFPKVQIKAETPTRSATGEQPSVGFSYMTLTDTEKPFHLLTVDTIDAV